LLQKSSIMKYATLLALAIVLSSCKSNTDKKAASPATLHSAQWLLGNWQNKTPEGLSTENWEQLNDSVYRGESYFVTHKNETTFAETMMLENTKGKMTYTVTTKNQNNELPVRFYLTKSSEAQLVFENPKHDFPTKITYTLVKPDSIVAVISGTSNGKAEQVTFPMKKIN